MARNDHLKYQVYRSEAFKQALQLLEEEQQEMERPDIDVDRVRLTPISSVAIDGSYNWGETEFNWEDVAKWKTKWPKGIDIALWFDQELCGMCYANPRDSKITIKIILLEGKPDKTHPLKGYVLPIFLTAIDAYARMLGCHFIEIQEPSADCIPWYEENGFEYDDQRRLVISVEAT